MLGKAVGRLVAGLITGLVSFLAGLVGGLLKGLAKPFASMAADARRRWRRKRDVRAIKKDWQSLKRGRVGSVSELGKRTRRRWEKRTTTVKKRLAS
jgi:hypothetical protein